jgi:AraC-like DNA-binding protein
MLSSEVPTLDAVAHELCMSGRTLQRKLSDEGVRFSDLLDEARKELAQQYLENGRIAMTQISDILGFTDANSFFRAFRRWTGSTPRAYRRWAQERSQQF